MPSLKFEADSHFRRRRLFPGAEQMSAQICGLIRLGVPGVSSGAGGYGGLWLTTIKISYVNRSIVRRHELHLHARIKSVSQSIADKVHRQYRYQNGRLNESKSSRVRGRDPNRLVIYLNFKSTNS